MDRIEFIFSKESAQAAAAFTLSLAGGALPIENLQALLYLADRMNLGKHGTPITKAPWFRGGGCPVWSRDIVDMLDGGWFRCLGSETVPVTVILNGHHEYFEYLSYAEAETILKTVWNDMGRCIPAGGKMADALGAVIQLPEVKNKVQCERITLEEIARNVMPAGSYTEQEWLEDIALAAAMHNTQARLTGEKEKGGC